MDNAPFRRIVFQTLLDLGQLAVRSKVFLSVAGPNHET